MGEIIPFKPDLSSYFRDLNLDWLEQYFYVEPHDRELLDNCEKVIINKGGFIFFYQENGVISGTVALIKLTEGVFELGKMAVNSLTRGKGIGQEMMKFCIKFAEDKGWEKIILYSNTTLENSIHIYRKFGFVEVPIKSDNPYTRGNIKMEKLLVHTSL